jgi:hypothetical protein
MLIAPTVYTQLEQNNMKQFSILIIVFIFTIPVFGQRGYYITDSTISVGIELINLGISNSYFCSVRKGNDVVKYSPCEVSGYGFNGGQVYKAFDIVIDKKRERYFFEQMVKGNINLYNLRLKGGINKYYILPNDSANLQELILNKTELQSLISNFIGNCSDAAQNLKYLKPNKYSLKRYLNYLNSCSNYPYPKVQYGFIIGIAGTQFYPIDKSSTYAIPNYNSDISFTISTFIDIPILSSNLSFNPEIYYKGNHYSKTFSNSNESFDLIMNYSSLSFPLLFKYSFLRDGNIPFILFGPIYSRVIKNKATLYKYEIHDNDIFIEINDSPIIQKNMGGFSIGGGIILDSEKKYKWFGEVRCNYLFNLNSKEKNFNLGEFSINTGILF